MTEYVRNWESWFLQHDMVTIHSPDEPKVAWANDAGGFPRWTVWAWSKEVSGGRSGSVIAWCDEEGSARMIAGTLQAFLGRPNEPVSQIYPGRG